MLRVFVDTAAWVAMINIRDRLYVRAWQEMTRLQQQKVPLVTTEFVLLEVADTLCTQRLRAQTVAFINGLQQLPRLQIIPISRGLFSDGWTLYCQRLDKEWSLTDCISFVVMARQRMTQAFTSDHHFEQAGFIKLL